MPRYRLKTPLKKDSDLEEVGWLDDSTEYYGIALLQWSARKNVRLFHPDGEGTIEVSREDVELC